MQNALWSHFYIFNAHNGYMYWLLSGFDDLYYTGQETPMNSNIRTHMQIDKTLRKYLHHFENMLPIQK